MFVLADLFILHVMRMRLIVICVIAVSTRFFQFISQTADFPKINVEHITGGLIFSTNLMYFYF